MFAESGAGLFYLLLFAGLAVYFVPTFVANARDHHNRGAIVALNVLLGWTLIGWAAALVWALTEVKKPGRRVYYVAED